MIQSWLPMPNEILRGLDIPDNEDAKREAEYLCNLQSYSLHSGAESTLMAVMAIMKLANAMMPKEEAARVIDRQINEMLNIVQTEKAIIKNMAQTN